MGLFPRWLVAAGLALAVLCPHGTTAQAIRGTCLDSATGHPISGVVVTAFDASHRLVARTLSSFTGTFALSATTPVATLELRHIGFARREIRLATTQGVEPLSISLNRLPSLLEPVSVRSDRLCPRDASAPYAYALLEQVRTALLNVVVSRESQLGRISVLGYNRRLAPGSEEILSQTVRLDSAARGTRSFAAVRTAKELVQLGFVIDSSAGRVFLGPDADVLVDEAFADGYCFHLAEASATRPNEIGLAFHHAGKPGRRVDIDGTIWVDSVRQELTDVTYEYRGLSPLTVFADPGGSTSFRQMPNGVTMVEEWQMRLASLVPQPAIDEGGGVLASVIWPDGTTWESGRLGTARLVVVDSAGRPVARSHLQLRSTDYAAVTDPTGTSTLDHLLPGPYDVDINEPRLAGFRIDLPPSGHFTAVAGATVPVRIVRPTLEAFVRARCEKHRNSSGGNVLVLGQVFSPDTVPVSGAVVTFDLPGLAYQYRTGSDGIFEACFGGESSGASVRLSVRAGPLRKMTSVQLSDSLALVRIQLDSLSSH